MPERFVRMRFMSSGQDKVKAELDELDHKATHLSNQRIVLTPEANTRKAKDALDGLSLAARKLSRERVTLTAEANTRFAKGSLDSLAETARRLGMMRPELTPHVNDTKAQARIKDLALKFDILSHKRADLATNVKDEKSKAKILSLTHQMDRLGRKIADPKVNLRDADLVEAQLLRIKATLDSLHNKDVRIRVRQTGGGLSSFVGGGRSGGGIGRIFSRLTRGRNGGLSGNTGPLQGLLSGGPGQALAGAGPEVIGALAGLVAGLLPITIGAGVGGLGAVGTAGTAIGLNKYVQAQLKTLRSQSTSRGSTQQAISQLRRQIAQARSRGPGGATPAQRRALPGELARLRLDQGRLSQTSQVPGDLRQMEALSKPFNQFNKTLQNVTHQGLMVFARAIKPALGPLGTIFRGVAAGLKTMEPMLSAFFKASLPFIRVFAGIMMRVGRIILPIFTQVMNQMVKSGSLKIFAQAIIEIAKGLGAFIKAMGPAMRPSALLFLLIAKLLGGAFNILGRMIGFVVAHWKLLLLITQPWVALAIEVVTHLHTIAHWFDVVRHAVATAVDFVVKHWKLFASVIGGPVVAAIIYLVTHLHSVTHVLDMIRHGFAEFGHFVARVFDVIRHDVAAIWDRTWRWVGSRLSTAVHYLTSLVHDIAHNIAHWFDTARHWVSSTWDALWHWAGNRLHDALNFYIHIASSFAHWISDTFDHIRHWVASKWDALWHWVGNRLHDALSAYNHALGSFAHWIADTFDRIRHWVASKWDGLWHWVGNRLHDAINFEQSALGRFSHWISDIFDRIKRWVHDRWDSMWKWVHDRAEAALGILKGVINRLEGIFKVPIKWVIEHAVDPLVRAWDAIAPHVGLPKLPIPGFASGGKVTQGTTTQADDVVVRVSRDETILSAQHSRQHADELASWGVPGYAKGGTPHGPKGHGSPGTLQARGDRGAKASGGGGIGGIFKHIAHDMFGLIPGALIQSLANLFPGGLGTGILGAIAKGGAKLGIHAIEDLMNSFLGNKGVPGMVKHTGDTLLEAMIKELSSAVANASGSGSDVAKWFVKTFHNTPYVFGGGSLHGTDCSGATAMAYEKFGLFPGHFPSRYGTSESQFRDMQHLKPGGQGQAGSLVFFAGSDGTKGNPGHVGITLDANRYASMYDTAEDFAIKPIRGSSGAVSGFRMPKHGFPKGSSGPTSPGLWSAARFLFGHGFTKAATAGIVGCIAGESGGNPESRGSGGAGLIGWTPESSAYPIRPIVTGNSHRDMGAQLTDLLAYIGRNGSRGDMNSYRNPMSAAWHFSQHYERPAVTGSDIRSNVVHSIFSRLDNGFGWLKPGPNLVYNGLGRMERIVDPDRHIVRGGNGGDVYNIYVSGTLDDNAAATKVQQALVKLKRNRGGAKLGLD